MTTLTISFTVASANKIESRKTAHSLESANELDSSIIRGRQSHWDRKTAASKSKERRAR